MGFGSKDGCIRRKAIFLFSAPKALVRSIKCPRKIMSSSLASFSTACFVRRTQRSQDSGERREQQFKGSMAYASV